MESRNCINSYVDEVGTPAISATAGNYREVGTSPGRSGEQNEGSNLNSRDIHRGRLGVDVLTMHRKGSFLKIGTWNVRTLYQIGKLENALLEMKNNRLDILGVAEMRWIESGSIMKGDYMITYSGGDQHQEGVGIIMHKKYAEAVMGFLPISKRVMVVKLQGKPFNLAVIQAYAPTADKPDEEIEEFYEDLEKAYKQVKSTDILVVMGDFNAKIGKGSVDSYVGAFGLGSRNERGDRLLDFCIEKDLVVANTLFQQPARRLYTWKSPGDLHRNQIDYIMVRRRYRNSIKDCRTYQGADINSDHSLLVSKMNFRLKKIKKRKIKEQYDLDMLKEERIQKLYAVEVVNRFNILRCEETEQVMEDSTEEKFTNFKESIHHATKECTKKKETNRNKEWMTDEILELINERKKIKEDTTCNSKEYNRKDKEIKKACYRAKEQWFNSRCDELLQLEKSNNAKEMHRKVKEVTGTKKKKTCVQMCIKDKNGNILFEKEKIEERWCEYIKELYDDKDRPDQVPVDDVEGPPILTSEVIYAMKRMKSGKAPGIDDIRIEHLKALDDVGIKILTDLCNDVYNTGSIPEEMKHSIFVKLPKKANATECSDYRTLCLMSNITKIILRVITERNRKIFERESGKTQSGFIQGMGTREGIFSLRIIIEKLLEKHKKIYICFIDYKKAFDRVYHAKLLETLKKLEIDGKDLNLIMNLYWQQTASIKTDEGQSSSFNIKRGVRQGCVLSPNLFNVYTEKIFKEFEDLPGIKMFGEYINNLRYADDTVLLAESEEELQTLVNAVKEGSLKYGLEMNTKKTKTMVIRKDINEVVNVKIKVDGVILEQVEKYQYLGQIITEDGRCENEIKRRIQIARTNFLKMKDVLVTKKLSIKTRKKLLHCYVISTLIYAAETWIINVADMKRIEGFEMWCLRKMLKVSYKEHKTNEEVMSVAGYKRSLKMDILRRKAKYLGHTLRKNGMQRQLLEAYIEGSRGRGRPRHTWLHNVKKGMQMTYTELVRAADDRVQFRLAVEKMVSS